MSEIRKRTFHNTAAALAVYDAGLPERDAAWAAILDDTALQKCLEADLAAMRLVQAAFYEDTADINSLADCQRIHVIDIRRVLTS